MARAEMKKSDDLPQEKQTGRVLQQGSADLGGINIVQRSNLKDLEDVLRKQWRLGQNIVLCWSLSERGLLVLFVPHYFLGNYCAGDDASENEKFVRGVVSSDRRLTRDELFAIANRFHVSPSFIKLKTPLSEDDTVIDAVEQLIKRYGLSYVDSRAVLLFDIVDFSLFTPFEQASQLNSLSYSLNSAYNKLLSRGIEVNFARTTTGDGYYVWNRNVSAQANQELFSFLLMVVADNAVAQSASMGNTVPVIRSAYHIGSHYELYQAEGINPTVYSYIVGDVTIELARMIEHAKANQILLGDFDCELPSESDEAVQGAMVSSPAFVRHCQHQLTEMQGVRLSNRAVNDIICVVSEALDGAGNKVPWRFRITDKHGLTRHAYNLQMSINIEGNMLKLGLAETEAQTVTKPVQSAGAMIEKQTVKRSLDEADELFDDLAKLLEKRHVHDKNKR